MTGETFGVGNDHPIGAISKHLPQCVDLCGRRATPCRCVCLVRYEYSLFGNRRPGDPARLGLTYHGFHRCPDVLDIETGAMERRVGGHGTEYFADGLEAPFPSCTG